MTSGRQQLVAFLEIHYNDVTTYWLQWKHTLHKMHEHYYYILLLLQSFILHIYFNSIVPVVYFGACLVTFCDSVSLLIGLKKLVCVFGSKFHLIHLFIILFKKWTLYPSIKIQWICNAAVNCIMYDTIKRKKGTVCGSH